MKILAITVKQEKRVKWKLNYSRIVINILGIIQQIRLNKWHPKISFFKRKRAIKVKKVSNLRIKMIQKQETNKILISNLTANFL